MREEAAGAPPFWQSLQPPDESIRSRMVKMAKPFSPYVHTRPLQSYGSAPWHGTWEDTRGGSKIFLCVMCGENEQQRGQRRQRQWTWWRFRESSENVATKVLEHGMILHRTWDKVGCPFKPENILN